jgi:hypothetical protein
MRELRIELEGLTPRESNSVRVNSGGKRNEFKFLKLLKNEPEKINVETEVPPFNAPGRLAAFGPGLKRPQGSRVVGYRASQIYSVKKYQAVGERLPVLSEHFTGCQLKPVEAEEKSKVARNNMKATGHPKMRKIEPHQSIVLRANLIESEGTNKVDLTHTFLNYEDIKIKEEELMKEKEEASSVVATMDSESLKRYDFQLISKHWSNCLVNVLRVSRYFSK